MIDKRKNTVSQMKKEEHMNSYREKIAEMVWQIEDVNMLKKIYTFAKTLNDILNEKEGG